MPRYEFSEGSSNKFWEIVLEGTSFTTTYGRIGTDGQMSMKEFDDEAKAKKEYDKLIAEKVKKGYELVGGNGGNGAAAKPAAAKPSSKKAVFDDEGEEEEAAPKKKAAAPKAEAKPAAKAGGGAKAPNSGSSKSGDAGARYFEFVEGSSSKFWEINLDGTSFTTRYGKIGTDGQQSMKEYDSPAQAKKEYEKLIAEKTKKGYVEL
jgi:predicted DNA-binding WGR domain protein